MGNTKRNDKYEGQMRVGKLKTLLATALVASLSCTAVARAATCPRDGALGTSRILSVDAASTPRVGLKQYPQTLPLGDHEVVLTFDDGPSPASTQKVLAALAAQCVQATFFLVGKPAQEHPTLVRRIAAGGHTIGHHTWSHRSLSQIPPDQALQEIDRGIEAVEMALHGAATNVPSTPFFRFPNFEFDARGRRPAAIARHRGVRRRSLGQRLEADDPPSGIEAGHRSTEESRPGNHPASRSQGADRGHAAGLLALSA